jgi:hypothetical protein
MSRIPVLTLALKAFQRAGNLAHFVSCSELAIVRTWKYEVERSELAPVTDVPAVNAAGRTTQITARVRRSPRLAVKVRVEPGGANGSEK